jgi:hypothetical protein
MNSKFIIAVLAASIIVFLGGWILFGIIFSNYYELHTEELAKLIMKKPPVLWTIAVSNIAWALVITWTIQRTNSLTFLTGFLTSSLISFLIITAFDFSMYGFFNIHKLNFVIFDILVSTLFWGIAGGVAGLILGIKDENDRIKTYFNK